MSLSYDQMKTDPVEDLIKNNPNYDPEHLREGYAAMQDRIKQLGEPFIPYSPKAIASMGESRIKDRTGYDVLGGVKEFAKGLPRAVISAGTTIAKTVQGASGADVVSPGLIERSLSAVDKWEKQNQLEAQQAYKERKFFPGMKVADTASSTASGLGFLGATAGAMAAGGAIGEVAGPVGGYLGATGGAAAVAQRSTAHDVMNGILDYHNEELIKQRGTGLTAEEQQALKDKYESVAEKEGLWQAIPYTIGMGLGYKLFTAPLASVMSKVLGEKIGGSAAAQVIAKLTGGVAEGTALQTVASMGMQQTAYEAGLPGSQEPDLWKTVKEVAPQMALLTAVAGPATMAGKAISDTIKIKALKNSVAAGEHENIPIGPEGTAFVKSFRDYAQSMSEAKPKDAELIKTVDTLNQEVAKRENAQKAVTADNIQSRIDLLNKRISVLTANGQTDELNAAVTQKEAFKKQLQDMQVVAAAPETVKPVTQAEINQREIDKIFQEQAPEPIVQEPTPKTGPREGYKWGARLDQETPPPEPTVNRFTPEQVQKMINQVDEFKDIVQPPTATQAANLEPVINEFIRRGETHLPGEPTIVTGQGQGIPETPEARMIARLPENIQEGINLVKPLLDQIEGRGLTKNITEQSIQVAKQYPGIRSVIEDALTGTPIKEVKANVEELQRQVVGGIEQGQEPGGAVQLEGGGTKATEASRIFQKQGGMEQGQIIPKEVIPNVEGQRGQGGQTEAGPTAQKGQEITGQAPEVTGAETGKLNTLFPEGKDILPLSDAFKSAKEQGIVKTTDEFKTLIGDEVKAGLIDGGSGTSSKSMENKSLGNEDVGVTGYIKKVEVAPEPQAAKEPWQMTRTDIESQYPISKKGVVDGRVVRDHIPNQESINASVENSTILPGIREVSMSMFDAPPVVNEKTKALAEKIKQSGEINPLIVVVDKDGPYILEGANRYDAMKINGAKSIPAQVVIDEGSFYDETKKALSEGKPVPPEVLSEYPDLAKSAEQPAIEPPKGTKISRGTYYFKDRESATQWAIKNNWPTDRIISYDKGYAVQLEKSGDYAGPGKIQGPFEQPTAEPTQPATSIQKSSETRSEALDKLTAFRETKPHSIEKTFGANGPTDEQRTVYDTKLKDWNKQYRELNNAFKKADDAEKATTEPTQPTEAAPINDRDTFTLDRVSGAETFKRGDYVKAWMGKDSYNEGEITGISQANKQFKVNNVWHDFGTAYKNEKPASKGSKEKMAPLSQIVEESNKKTWKEPAAVEPGVVNWNEQKLKEYNEGRTGRIDTTDEYRLSNSPDIEVYKKANPVLKNNPKEITIYRATEGKDIQPGDWVYLRKDLADKHLENRPGARVLSQKVPLSDIIVASDDVEFVYSPKLKGIEQTKQEPWQSSALAEKPNIPIGQIETKKQADGYGLFYRGTRNEVFQGERFKSASEGRNFFKAQQVKAQEAGKAVEGIKEPVAIEETKTGKAVSVPMPDNKANTLSPKEQKAYLFAEIDKAISGEKPGIEPNWYEFNVPGDGQFHVVGPELPKFRKLAESFDRPLPKKEVGKVTKPAPLKTRITGEGVQYYNPFRPREQGIIEGIKEFIPNVGYRNKNYFADGYFSNGHYIVKTGTKPKIKTGFNEETPPLSDYIKEHSQDTKPAQIAGEFHMGETETEPAYIHIKSEDGTLESGFNAKYIDSILTQHPDAKVFLENSDHPNAVFKDGEKVVGMVMPIVEGAEVANKLLSEIQGRKGISETSQYSTKPIDTQEKGIHRPMTVESGSARLHDLEPAFGKDIYDNNAIQYFGTGEKAIDAQTLRILKSVKDKPEMEITAYRAIQKGETQKAFVPGDWVTVNKNYAKDHGEGILGGDYKIIEQKVKVKDLTTNVDSFNEQGYYPEDKKSYSTATQSRPFADISLSDIKSMFPRQTVGLNPDGSVTVAMSGGHTVDIKSVNHISPDEVAFEIGHGKKLGPEQAIAGEYQNGTIRLVRGVADKWTVAHEATHFAEETGLLFGSDLRAIDRAVQIESKAKKVTAENRAKWIEDNLYNRSLDRQSRLGRIVQKVRDFIDSLVNLAGRTTARGVLRGFESGKIFDREGKAGMNEFASPASYQKTADKWFSQMGKFLSDKLPGKSEAKSLAKTIQTWGDKGLFKPEELEWSGVKSWLESQKGPVTKQQVLDYLSGNNVRVEEVEKGEGIDIAKQKAEIKERIIDDMASEMVKEGGRDGDWDYESAREYLEQHEQEVVGEKVDEEFLNGQEYGRDSSKDTKFSQYQVPGGENYRELLLTLPRQSLGKFKVMLGDKVVGEFNNYSEASDYTSEHGKAEHKIIHPINPNYTSAHWDEPNVLAHVRFNERTGANGERTLFIEEIQSDWHQKGRKEGYNKSRDQLIKELKDVGWWSEKDISSDNYVVRKGRTAQVEYGKTEDAAWDVLIKSKDQGVKKGTPDAPFKKTWPLLTIKRMVRYAAENGFDSIAWTPGEVQAERYDLSKQVSEVTAKKWVDSGKIGINFTTKEGKIETAGEFKPEDIPGVVGKDLANKIVSDMEHTEDHGVNKYSGLDLKVGGEGMKGFYDKILPAEVNKFFNKKEWGNAKVETVDIHDPKGTGRTMAGMSGDIIKIKDEPPIAAHMLPITPEMRHKALYEGMPMYQAKQSESPLPRPSQATHYSARDINTAMDNLDKAQEDLSNEKLGFIEKTKTLLNPFKVETTVPSKEDLTALDLLTSLPQFIKDKAIPAIKKSWEATQNKETNFNNNLFEFETHEGTNGIELLGDAEKDKAFYGKFKKYNIQRDKYNVRYMVKSDADLAGKEVFKVIDPEGNTKSIHNLEAEANAKTIEYELADLHGWTPEQKNVQYHWRIMSDKPLNMLMQGGRDLITENEAINAKRKEKNLPFMELPTVADWVDGKKVQISLKAAITKMGELRGSFFPRLREEGEYLLYADKEGKDSFMKKFTSSNAMEAKKKEYELNGYTVKTKKSDKMSEDVFALEGGMIKTQQLLNEALDRMNKMDPKSVTDADAMELYKNSQLMLGTALAENMSNIFRERGGMVHMNKRAEKYYKGFEEDPKIAMSKYLTGTAATEAKKVMMSEMLKAITGTDVSLDEFLNRNPEATVKDYHTYVKENMIEAGKQPKAFKWAIAYIKEMSRNPELADRVIAKVSGLATGKYLAFRIVAGPLINVTALPTSAVATMHGAGISFFQSPRLLANAIKTHFQYKWYGPKSISPDEVWALDYMRRNGWDNAQWSPQAILALRSKMGRAYDNVIQKGMFFFSESEKMNRVATILGTYNGLRNGSMKGQSREAIMERAKQVSDDAHGTYNKGNTPYLAMGQNPAAQLARMFMVFTRFSHTYLLNMKKLGIDQKDYKAAAYMAIAPAILAGAGASVITPVVASLLKAFGMDDPEEDLYSKIGELFTPGAEKLARHGLTGALGFSTKGSLAIGITNWPTSIGELMGAPGSVIKDVLQGGASIARGDVSKGVEKLLPTGIGNIARAYRESTEGFTTKTNAPIFYGNQQIKLTPMEAFLRAASLNPERTAAIQEKQFSEKEIDAKYKGRRNDLYARLKRYWISGNRDATDYAEILGSIQAYNEDAVRRGLNPITRNSIRMNIKRVMKPSRRERYRVMQQENDEEQ